MYVGWISFGICPSREEVLGSSCWPSSTSGTSFSFWTTEALVSRSPLVFIFERDKETIHSKSKRKSMTTMLQARQALSHTQHLYSSSTAQQHTLNSPECISSPATAGPLMLRPVSKLVAYCLYCRETLGYAAHHYPKAADFAPESRSSV